MNTTQSALNWLFEQHGWRDDEATWLYVNDVLCGGAAQSFKDQQLILAAGGVAGYWC